MSTVSALHAEATRAFLQRNYASAITQSAAALSLALSSSPSGSTEEQHTAKLLILRITALSTLYTAHAADSKVRKEQTVANISSSPSSSDDRLKLELADPRQMLDMDTTAFLAHLWSDTLLVCNPKMAAKGALQAALQPASEDMLLLALAVPANVLVTLIFACLKLDDDSEGVSSSKKSALESKTTLSASTPSLTNGKPSTAQLGNQHGPQAGLFAARSISEWFLAAYTSADKSSTKPTTADETYSRIIPLYCLHLVALRSNEWEYAAETIGYSVLDEETKRALLGELEGLSASVAEGGERRRRGILEKVLEGERKVSKEKVRVAVAAASGGQQQQPQQHPQQAPNGKRSQVAKARPNLSASTPALSQPSPSPQPTSPRPAHSARDDTEEGHLTTDLIRAANDNVRTRRDQELSSSSNPSSPAVGTLPVQQQQQQPTRGGVSTMLSTYLSPRTWSFSRYISLILFVLAIAYPRLRSASGLGQAKENVVGNLVKRMWDTVRMGTQVTYL
ncbi:hypothetical protein CF319_g5463 [Tilletia indica]|nr:hypothetical protein CF319_g5463 [Tilletia indica]